MTRNKYAIAETIAATATLGLDEASVDTVSSWLVHVEATGFTGTIDIEGRALGSSLTFVGIAYKDMTDGTIKTAQLTGGFLVLIDASGLDVQLDIAVSAGSLDIVAQPLIG
jgi:hypothetical protein